MTTTDKTNELVNAYIKTLAEDHVYTDFVEHLDRVIRRAYISGMQQGIITAQEIHDSIYNPPTASAR